MCNFYGQVQTFPCTEKKGKTHSLKAIVMAVNKHLYETYLLVEHFHEFFSLQVLHCYILQPFLGSGGIFLHFSMEVTWSPNPTHKPGLLDHTTATNRRGWMLTCFLQDTSKQPVVSFQTGRKWYLPSSAYMSWVVLLWLTGQIILPSLPSPILLYWLPATDGCGGVRIRTRTQSHNLQMKCCTLFCCTTPFRDGITFRREESMAHGHHKHFLLYSVTV